MYKAPECKSKASMRSFNLFISHSWTYGDTYDRLTNLLRNRTYFDYKDYSVPRDDPIHTTGSDRELRAAIRRRMRPCSIVLVVAGVYVTYSKWIKTEISLARKGFGNPKPILGIVPWGSKRKSSVVSELADEVVKWNTESIVKAIRRLS